MGVIAVKAKIVPQILLPCFFLLSALLLLKGHFAQNCLANENEQQKQVIILSPQPQPVLLLVLVVLSVMFVFHSIVSSEFLCGFLVLIANVACVAGVWLLALCLLVGVLVMKFVIVRVLGLKSKCLSSLSSSDPHPSKIDYIDILRIFPRSSGFTMFWFLEAFSFHPFPGSLYPGLSFCQEALYLSYSQEAETRQTIVNLGGGVGGVGVQIGCDSDVFEFLLDSKTSLYT